MNYIELKEKAEKRIENLSILSIAEMVEECIDIIDTINYEMLNYNEYQKIEQSAVLPLDALFNELIKNEAIEKYNALSEKEQEQTSIKEIEQEIYDECLTQSQLAEKYFTDDNKQQLIDEIKNEVFTCLENCAD